MEVQQTMNSKIKGWGSDAELEKRPYHPVHKPQPDTGAHWMKPEAQKKTVEILKSTERPDLTAVYGTPNPPKGLSGVIRRFAFKYSESSFAHWLPLILADRIDFVEGMFEDIAKGKMPRILADGYAADYKYDKKKFYFRVAKTVIVGAGAIYLVSYLMREKA